MPRSASRCLRPPLGLDAKALAVVARHERAIPAQVAAELGYVYEGPARCALKRLLMRGRVEVIEQEGGRFRPAGGRAYRVSAAGREAIEEAKGPMPCRSLTPPPHPSSDAVRPAPRRSRIQSDEEVDDVA